MNDAAADSVPDLELVAVPRPAGPQDRLLFLIHGYGEPPSMLVDHLDRLDPDGRYAVVTPIAPFAKKGKPIWHRALNGGSSEATEQFLRSLAALQRDLAKLVANGGFDSDEVVVGGFSQGAGLASALMLGADGPVRPAACLAFCGFVPPVAGLRVDLARAEGRPFFLSSATDDSFVSLDASHASAACFEVFGFDVTAHELHCRHEINGEAASLAGAWLADIGASPTPPPSTRVGTVVPEARVRAGGLLEYALDLWHVVGP